MSAKAKADKSQIDAKSKTDDAAAKAAEEAAAKAEESKSDDDADDAGDKKPVKTPKTYTKAELEAERQKAVDEAKKKWDDEKDLSELDRLKKENEDIKASVRLRDARDEVVAALEKAGAKSPGLAFNSMKDQLKFDDAGKLVNTKDLIDSLKGDFPEQFGEEKPSETIDGGAGQKGTGEKLTAEKLAAMAPVDINKLDWAEVTAVMEQQKN